MPYAPRVTVVARFRCAPAGSRRFPGAAGRREPGRGEQAHRQHSEKVRGRLAAEVAAPLLRESAELALHAAMQSIRAQVQDAVQARQYARALDFLAGLKGAVDEFFDHVLVNDPDTALRSNRLALLAQLRAMFSGIADLSRLPG